MRLSLPVSQVRTVRWHTGFWVFFFFFGCIACAGSRQWECRVWTSEQPANSLCLFWQLLFLPAWDKRVLMLTCPLCSMLPFDKATTSLEIAGSSQGPTSDWGTSDSLVKEVHSLQHFSRSYQDVFSHAEGKERIHSSLYFSRCLPKCHALRTPGGFMVSCMNKKLTSGSFLQVSPWPRVGDSDKALGEINRAWKNMGCNPPGCNIPWIYIM